MYLNHKKFLNKNNFCVASLTGTGKKEKLANNNSDSVSNFMSIVFIILQPPDLHKESRVSCMENLGY